MKLHYKGHNLDKSHAKYGQNLVFAESGMAKALSFGDATTLHGMKMRSVKKAGW